MSEQKKQQESSTVNPQVLFENPEVIVVEKPSGWVVNDAITTKDPTIQSWVENTLDTKISKSRLLRNGIVHRLDKETSGCLIVAKNEKSFELLQKQFEGRLVQKTYLALVHGIIEKSGEIDLPLGRLPGGKFGEVSGGRDAKTGYKLLKTFESENGEFSLVEVFPKTGRTHQIRVHMKAIHHPLVSDKLYVGRKNYRKDIKWCPRLFLHAGSISFISPQDNKRVEVKSALPEDLEQVLQSFSR